jgi:hypothetical protein
LPARRRPLDEHIPLNDVTPLNDRVALSDLIPPERQLRFVLVVKPTPERQVASRRLAPDRVRLDVMELQVRSLAAPAAACGDEGALPPVAQPDLALDRDGDVP